jgi:hypothetical protein
MNSVKRFVLCLVAILVCSPSAHSGEKTLMHCFAWTPVKDATPADWEAFFKASEALPEKIKGIRRIWYGKLLAPLSQASLVKMDKETFQKYFAGDQVSSEIRRTPREFGMCMEMTGEDALKAYDTDAYHKIWTDAYSKIRVDGTTTFDFVGQ